MPLFDLEGSVPNSLLDICLTYIVRHLDIICYDDAETGTRKLNKDVALPRELWEMLIQVYHSKIGPLDDDFINVFMDSSVSRLSRVCIRNSKISNNGLKAVLKHKLVELELEKCEKITMDSFSVLNTYGENIENLTIGSGVELLPVYDMPVNMDKKDPSFILNTPKLKRLVIRHLMITKEHSFFQALFTPLQHLIYLDLSGFSLMEDFNFLCSFKNLEHLVLYNVLRIQPGLPSIYKLKKLRHLDISQSNENRRKFINENETLADIVTNLPNLVSLDISGTNLAGSGVAERSYCGICDIPGLYSRIKNPLKFLGLYGTQNGACRRHDIPAIKISGDANETQILIAGTAYLERPEILQKVLNDLYHLFRYEQCGDVVKALSVVLAAMDRHTLEKHIQISASAILFYIMKSKEMPSLSSKIRHNIISSLLNGMSNFREDDTMLRNGCLTLCQFRIPHDMLFEYERLVTLLLITVSKMDQEGFVQRIAIYLLNSLACQVDNQMKQLLGDLGVIERMLQLIELRVTNKVCDDVLEIAWSTMWNVTDETPINCKRFLDGNGMDYFSKCLVLFPNKDELMRNMMGLMGNVAEVRHLRQRLMEPNLIEKFNILVHSTSDGIEVSYNAAGVLSHLASDGEEAWSMDCLSRNYVLANMVSAIERWDLTTERNINYRSFEPILQLARVRHTPPCQHWAVWALANLTKVYPEKYCVLFESEGGIEILQDIINDEMPYERIKALAKMILLQCKNFRDNGEIDIEPQLDG